MEFLCHLSYYIFSTDLADHSEPSVRVKVFICDLVLSKQQPLASVPSHLELRVKQLLVIAYHWLLVEVTAVSRLSPLPLALLHPPWKGDFTYCVMEGDASLGLAH